MSPTLTCLALALVGGVDLGYQPAANGGLELIVQIDANTFQTLRENDPISVAVPREAQQVRPSQITVALGSARLPQSLPPQISPPQGSPLPGTAAAPATAPRVRASPIPNTSVLPATVESPLPSTGGPSLTPGDAQGPARIPPPSGAIAAPTTTNEQSQGAADPRATASGPAASQQGNSYTPSAFDNGDSKGAISFNGKQLFLVLLVIALAASNGYVGWLFLDARQRYLGLLARTFAPAGHAGPT